MPSRKARRSRLGRKFSAHVGSIIAALRSDAGFSQDALAEATGITKVRISRLEGGYVRLLAEEIPPLCSALGVGAYRFLPTDGGRV